MNMKLPKWNNDILIIITVFIICFLYCGCDKPSTENIIYEKLVKNENKQKSKS